MRVYYFAWLRERIGAGFEEVSPPEHVRSAADLADWLKSRSPRHAAAFADMRAVRVAIDQEQSAPEDEIIQAREVAFFPPVTGG